MTVGKNTYNSPISDGKDYPIMPELKKEGRQTVKYETRVFKNYILKCLPFVSTDEGRPALMGIHYKQADKLIEIEAVDSWRMLNARDITENEEKVEVTIPTKFATTYAKIYDGENTELMIDKRAIKLVGEGFILQGKLLEESFPDTASIFAFEPDHKIEIEKDKVLDGLKRLLIINKGSKVTKWIFNENGLQIKAENKDYQMSGTEFFACPHKGEEQTIGLNTIYAITCIEAFRGEKVFVNFHNFSKPVTITDEVGAIKTLVMPLSI